MIFRNSSRVLIVAALFTVPLCLEGAVRTFVSALSGFDTNNCSRSAPCRNFAAAILQTNANGEVVVLDSGGYGPVTVTSPVQLIAPPSVHAAIAPTSGIALTIDAPASMVVLKGLTLVSQGAGFGLWVTGVGVLFVERFEVIGFPGAINISLSANEPQVTMDNVYVRKSLNGITISTTAGLVQAHLSRVFIDWSDKAGTGMIVSSNAEVVATDCRSTGNFVGFSASSNGKLTLERCVSSGNTHGVRSLDTAAVFVSNCTIAGNSTNGVFSSSGTIRLAGSTVTANTTGVFEGAGGSIISRGDNNVEGNGTDGDLPDTFNPK